MANYNGKCLSEDSDGMKLELTKTLQTKVLLQENCKGMPEKLIYGWYFRSKFRDETCCKFLLYIVLLGFVMF